MFKIAGIYEIVINGKKYIGSSINVYKRGKSHLSLLRLNKHTNQYLQNSYNKHKNYCFNILETFDYITESELRDKEKLKIEETNSLIPNGYNICLDTQKNSGFTFTHTLETKEKISKSKLGITFSQEHKDSLSKALTGRTIPKNVVEKIKKANIGKKRKDTSKMKIAAIKNAIKKANSMRKTFVRCPKSGLKGVYEKRDKWQVKIKIDKKDMHFGVYKDKETAGHVYDYWMLKTYGANTCYLNFPNFDYTNWKLPEKQKPIKIYQFRKLGMEKAQQLRKDSILLPPIELSKKYNITLTAVYRILNNLTYRVKKQSILLGGTSLIDVVYNPSIADMVLAI